MLSRVLLDGSLFKLISPIQYKHLGNKNPFMNPNPHINGLKIVKNMIRYALIEADHGAYLDAIFGLESAELDLLSLKENFGDLPQLTQLQAQITNIRSDLLEKAAHATPKVIDYEVLA